MALLKIVIEPDPRYGKPSQRLRQKSARIDRIDDATRKLAEDMFETMMAANGVVLPPNFFEQDGFRPQFGAAASYGGFQ